MLRTLRVANVREAYVRGVQLILEQGIEEPSRNGPVLVLDGPLVTTYTRPWERVLLDPMRDANPFFHLMESIWMLAGRRDVESLMRYNAGMAKYSDDGINFHGAYGHRWRRHFGQDQLVTAIRLLRAEPGDRRVVIEMWDPAADLGQQGLDFPCNTHLYLRVRKHKDMHPNNPRTPLLLDMTVMCRSNDMVWGGYGANAVHFSVLHEFLAAMVGVRQGELHQLSNNAHVYTATMPTQAPILRSGPVYGPTVPLFGDLSAHDPSEVLAEIECLWIDDEDGEVEHLPATTIQLLSSMRRAWDGWKTRDWKQVVDGLSWMAETGHLDWHQACREWLERRRDKFS